MLTQGGLYIFLFKFQSDSINTLFPVECELERLSFKFQSDSINTQMKMILKVHLGNFKFQSDSINTPTSVPGI